MRTNSCRLLPTSARPDRQTCSLTPGDGCDFQTATAKAGVATIAFDVRPGNSGLARYVGSIVRALPDAGMSAVFFDDRCQTATPEDCSHSAGGPRSARSTLRGAIPKPLRLWAGFGRESRRIARTLRGVSFDLLHTQRTGCEEAPVGAWWAGARHRLGTFHVDWTCDVHQQRSGLAHRALEWFSTRRLRRAIAVSEATRQNWIHRSGISADRIITIHNGIDSNRFCRTESKAAARARLDLPRHAVILGCLGRLEPEKGFEFLIEGLALLCGEFPTAYVVIAGTGTQASVLSAKAQSAGIANRFILIGFHSDINRVLDAFDLLVMPSLSDALGYALLEGMAHELPAVGTQVGGIPEVILPGETGFLCKQRDPVALAAAIRPLLDSAELRERLGRAGRQCDIKHFHEDDMVQKTIAVYRQMLWSQVNKDDDAA